MKTLEANNALLRFFVINQLCFWIHESSAEIGNLIIIERAEITNSSVLHLFVLPIRFGEINVGSIGFSFVVRDNYDKHKTTSFYYIKINLIYGIY